MANYLKRFSAVLLLVCAQPAISAEYPTMEGVWVGNIRVVSSGTPGQVSTGGAVITDTVLTLTIDYQDLETFIGRYRTTGTASSSEGSSLWGSIRSNGEEAMFVTSTGGNGLIWFENDSRFEYCYTNVTAEEVITAFCAVLTKQQ